MLVYYRSLLMLFLVLPEESYSQVYKPIETSKVAAEIDSNSTREIAIYDKLRIQDSLLELQRIHYTYLSYKAKYELAAVTPEKNERILLYKRIRSFPFYTVRQEFYGHELSELYRKATRDLIFEYRGDLTALINLDIVPSMRSTLYGFLRVEIEYAGGTWDKGEISLPQDVLLKSKRSKN